MKRVLLLVAGVLISGVAWSESWVGVNYAALEQDNRFYRAQSERLDTTEIFVRLGADMNDIFGSELRVGSSLEATEEEGYSFEHNYILGGFLRTQYEMGAFSPYLIAGVIRGEEEVILPSGNMATSEFDDIAAGIGVDFDIGETFGINAEYMRYYDIGTVMLRGPSLGVHLRF
jgi:hypothetical protein